jgi:hypothetical protein
MKKIYLFMMLLIASTMWSLQIMPGHGEVAVPAVDDTMMYYHQHRDDLHLSGVDNWAVRFAADEYYTGLDSLTFQASGAWVYFPVTPQNQLELQLADTDVNQPGTLLTSEVVPASQLSVGWNYISFDQTYTARVLWLLVNYDTSETQPLSASVGDGMQSYYLFDEYYYRFADQSIMAELMISLQGYFLFDEVDLELLDFSMQPNPAYDDRFYPVFTVMNNSATTVDAYTLHFTVSNAVGSIQDSVQVTQPLAPLEVAVLDYTGTEHAASYLDEPALYTITARVSTTGDVVGGNNAGSDRFDTFDEPLGTWLLENIVLLEDTYSENLWMQQEQLIDVSQVKALNYFPSASDEPYFALQAQLRQNFYALPGLPLCIAGGSEYIIGYDEPFFSDSLQIYQQHQLQQTTFITDGGATGTFNPDTEQVDLAITLQNIRSYIPADYLSDCDLWIAVTETDTSNAYGIFGDVFQGMPYSAPIHISHDSTEVIATSFDLSDYCEPLGVDYTQLHYVYWVQNSDDKRVYITGQIDHTDLEEVQVSVQEPLPQARMQLSLGCNPISSQQGAALYFSAAQPVQSLDVAVYNIRGQRVTHWEVAEPQQRTPVIWNCRDAAGRQVSSGVYLFKLSAPGYRSAITRGVVLRK